MVDCSNMSALVVEPEGKLAELVSSLLQCFGTRCIHEAADALGALASLDRTVPTVVLIDQMLEPGRPDASLALVRRIRQRASSEGGSVPVILVAENTEPNFLLEARNLGVNEVLRKPIAVRELHAKVKMVTEADRGFVAVGTYRGPDRRRARGALAKVERRHDDPRALVDPVGGDPFADDPMRIAGS